MSTSVYLITIVLFFGTILLIFGMRYFSHAFTARARGTSDAAFRSLADQLLEAQARTQASLAAIETEIARTAASLAAVEKILKQVE